MPGTVYPKLHNRQLLPLVVIRISVENGGVSGGPAGGAVFESCCRYLRPRL